jgi:hypothetical protein
MTTESEIGRWKERLRQERLKRDFQKYESEKENERKSLMKEYFDLKYEKPISAGKKICQGFKKIGQGFMAGINEIQKFNSNQEKGGKGKHG